MTQRIRAVRDQLAIRRARGLGGIEAFNSLRPVAKAKWTKLLEYNCLDCESLRRITLAAANCAPTEEGLFGEGGWTPPC